MKLYKNRNQLLIMFLAVGFFIGILYENIISKSQGMSVELFQSYFLKQFAQVEIIAEEYLWYVARARVVPLLLIVVLGFLRWKKAIVSAALLWIGFLMGIISVSAVIQLGIKGILICVAGLFPHMICYGLSYGMIFLYLYRYPSRQWNHVKTIFVVLTMFLGIILETYLSPLLLKLVIRMI